MKNLRHWAFADDAPQAEPLFFQPPTGGTAGNGKPIYSWDQAAAQITRDGVSWGSALGQPVTITYAFRSGVTAAETSQWIAGVSGFAPFNATQITVTEEMLHLWSEVANINFVRVGSGTSGAGAYSNNAQILFGDFTMGPAAFSAFTYFPPVMGTPAADIDGNLWVNVSRNYDANPAAFPLGGHILAHEIGHALGLNHPGDYNSGANGGATYANDAQIWQDTAMFSNMSYFDASFTGGDYGSSYALAPQMFDIAAIQRLYGVNMTTRTGDTTYGFHANAGDAVFSIGSAAQTAIFCIWDAGGNDTLDLSGYATSADIDLRPESFSSDGPDGIGGLARYNISIARGVIIENAIGGAAADTFTGNDVANHLTGNAGNDVMNGGLGVDMSIYASASTSDSWHRNPDGSWTVTAGAEGTDTLTSVEDLHFTDRDVFLHNAARTFSGDGTSDILFRRADGVMASWEVNGASITQSHFLPTAAPSQWHALGTGDFTGDGKDDILWQRTDGLVYTWAMNGSGSVSAATPVTGLGAEWHFLGIGDFNGDQHADIAWQRDDGLVYTWSMNGAAITQVSAITGLSSAWHMQGVGDFNSDGKDDFLWRNSDSGQMVIWEMNGAGFVASGLTSQQTDLGWSVKGIGDFNGDGRDDILMQRGSDGMVQVWTMNGLTVTAQTDVAAVSPAQWSIHNIGDYNGDGKDDILWQKSDGLVYVWLMDGAHITAANPLSGVDPSWGII